MSLIIINADEKNEYIPLVKELYISAFPEKERISFKNILRLCKMGKSELLVLIDNNEFVGFTHLIHYKDLVFILYFAIHNKMRGKEYGGKALKLIRDTYANKRMILNIETTKGNMHNQEQRLKRKLFYLNNGYTEAGLSIEEKGETYDMLIIGGTIEKEEYHELLKFMMGRVIFWLIGPKVFHNYS